MRSRGLLDRKYEVFGLLGEGTSGSVMRGRRRADGKEVALKVALKEGNGRMGTDRVATEVEVLRGVECERVVGLLDVVESRDYTCVVMDLVRGGDLDRLLKVERREFAEGDIMRVMEGVLQALEYLHERGVAHRDVKLANIMLQDGDCSRVKLVDFGLAFCRKDPLEKELCNDRCGTAQYAAPEILSSAPYDPEKVDMWCLGVVVFALFTKKMPFHGSCRRQLFEAIAGKEVSLEGPEWRNVSKGAKALVRSLLSKDPEMRPSASDCLEEVMDMVSQGPTSSRGRRTPIRPPSVASASSAIALFGKIRGRFADRPVYSVAVS